VAWHATTRIMAGVGDLVQRTGDGRTGHLLSGQAIERSGGAVCRLYRARRDEERGFLGWASKRRSMVCQRFGLKPTGTIFSGLASKPVAMVFSGWVSKPVLSVSPGLGLKPVVTVLWFGPQNWMLWFGDLDLKITVTLS
jgi:hypothetical protein